ncbi:hypothetical protein MHM582_2086 [Microbacterium sp. HM58-2]|nr:hypothetical protein MHM582_2086 [Microbacterium sp. HM58-2]
MPADQITEDAPNPVDFPARPATGHLSVATDVTPVVPERRGLFPLAPWRWVLVFTGLGLAGTCGVASANPAWNGADLGVLISLAIFVAAFTPGKD